MSHSHLCRSNSLLFSYSSKSLNCCIALYLLKLPYLELSSLPEWPWVTMLSPQLLAAALQRLKTVSHLLFDYTWSPVILLLAPWPWNNQIVLGSVCSCCFAVIRGADPPSDRYVFRTKCRSSCLWLQVDSGVMGSLWVLGCGFLGPPPLGKSASLCGVCLWVAARAGLGRTTLHTVWLFSLFHQHPLLAVAGNGVWGCVDL